MIYKGKYQVFQSKSLGLPPIGRKDLSARKRYYALRSEIRRLRRRHQTCWDFEWYAESLSLKSWSENPIRRLMNDRETRILGIVITVPAQKLP